MNSRIVSVMLLAAAMAAGVPGISSAQPARDLYTRALARERVLRDGERPPTVKQIRLVVAAYERVVRRHPASGYSDNALWQAGNLSLLAYQQFGEAEDRRAGVRLLKQLKAAYPSSSLLERWDETMAAFDAPPADRPVPSAPLASKRALPKVVSTTGETTLRPVERVASTHNPPATIRGITRTPLENGVRVSIEVDGEVLYHEERLTNPHRVFFDLKGARPAPALVDATLHYDGDLVQEIRLGRHPQNTTRVVMDMDGADSYSVFTLYNPYRVVVDFRRTGAPAVKLAPLDRLPASEVAPKSVPALPTPKPAAVTPPPAVTAAVAAAPIERIPASRTAATASLPPPAVPAANSNGTFSIARQLGLGVSRVVIDPGHGGHDPGAHGTGIDEAELVLDVALRLRKLLEAQPGMEVVMTRDTDVFIPLEERTAIANRQGADLFLSIHANASRNPKARGIETYFLNFASNPEAEAVAARENSASGKRMHSLPEIVRAITLNNKIDESRDFAEMIQKSMVRKLATRNAQLRDLGVKQAPFVVLIGAGMPSVLAEISFVTHKQEGQLLKTPVYRQQIADALFDAVLQYQRSLKTRNAIAARED